jgi:signal transduction histidine kinase
MMPTPVDVTQLLREALADFCVQAEQKQITLRDEIPADAPPIMGQVYQLRKVVDNLMSNALKFTPDTGNVTISLTYDGQGLTIQVTDTGIGIPADKLDRIFERFYQVDGSASRRYGGTGLGLALAKEITKVHGGRITVESQVGQGSTFTVWLPLS